MPQLCSQCGGMDADKILLALDTLACALADHHHQWTLEDKHIYEQALLELGISHTTDQEG